MFGPGGPAGQAKSQETELVSSLAWALDLVDHHEQRLIELGEPPEKVYTPLAMAGLEKARAVLEAARRRF